MRKRPPQLEQTINLADMKASLLHEAADLSEPDRRRFTELLQDRIDQEIREAFFGMGTGSATKTAGTVTLSFVLPSWCGTLGIEPGATVSQINRAYRRKAMTAHPDHGGSHAAMRKLNEARTAALKFLQGVNDA